MSCGNQPEGAVGSEDAPALMPRKRAVRRVEKGICQKCKEAKSFYIIRTVTYCQECFQTNVIFRLARQLFPPLRPSHVKSRSSQLAMNRPPKQKGHALIALSGGAGSTSMLEMLMDRNFIGSTLELSEEKRRHKPQVIWDQGTVLYVEYCNVIQNVGLTDRIEELRDLATKHGLRFVGLRAEDVFDPALGQKLGRSDSVLSETFDVNLLQSDLPISSSSSKATPLESLRSLLSSLPAPSRPAILSNILDHLITLTAQSLPNISHVLLGETSSRQAERVISGTALGRGWSLPLELSSSLKLPKPDSSDHDGNTDIVRLKPMKDVTIKEAAIYCRLKRVETVNSRGWGLSSGGSDSRGKGSISTLEMLTEQFVAGLSVTHPSTVSTINRTGDKLVFPGDLDDATLCPVCQLPVDPSALDWKSRTALTTLPGKLLTLGEEKRSTQDSAKNDDNNSDFSLAPLLCYGCLTTFTPTRPGKTQVVEPVSLPLWIGDRARSRTTSMKPEVVSRKEMEDQIGQYLIPVDDVWHRTSKNESASDS